MWDEISISRNTSNAITPDAQILGKNINMNNPTVIVPEKGNLVEAQNKGFQIANY